MMKRITLVLLALLVSWASFATITGSSSICLSTTEIYTDSGPAGGTWSSSGPVVAITPSGTTATVMGITAGTTIISYVVGSTVSTKVVTVNAAPVPIIGGGVAVCGGTSVTLSDATIGGSWSVSGAGGAAYFSVPGSSVLYTSIVPSIPSGVATVVYAIGSCSVTTTVTVNTTAIDSITGPNLVCVGSAISLANAVPGGVWTSYDPTIATVNSTTGVVTGVAAGAAIINYATTGPCGSVSMSWYVTVTNTPPVPTLAGVSTVTVGGSVYLNASVTAGSWTSANPSIATVISAGPWLGQVTGVSAGTATISYSTPGCSGPSLVATRVVTVNSTTTSGISGHVLFSGTQSARVWLIKYDPSALSLAAVDSVNVTGTDSAYYQFMGLSTDSFRVKAALTGSTTPAFLPTYHTSSFYWNTAAVIPHVSGIMDLNKDINMIAGIPVSGPGFIGGSVITGANKGTADGAPVAGMNVYLLNAATHAVIKHTTTDASGNYSFTGLPLGIYDVFPEELSYLTTPYLSVTLTTAAPSMTTAKFMERTVSRKITPIGAVAVNELQGANTSIVAFPNPTSGKLNINWEAATSEVATLIITDVTGREVLAKDFSMTKGSGAEVVDLSSLTNGMYFVSVRSASAMYINKIEVRH